TRDVGPRSEEEAGRRANRQSGRAAEQPDQPAYGRPAYRSFGGKAAWLQHSRFAVWIPGHDDVGVDRDEIAVGQRFKSLRGFVRLCFGVENHDHHPFHVRAPLIVEDQDCLIVVVHWRCHGVCVDLFETPMASRAGGAKRPASANPLARTLAANVPRSRCTEGSDEQLSPFIAIKRLVGARRWAKTSSTALE